MDRQIIHLYIPSFSVEVQRVCRPEFMGKPVVVALPNSERALVLSVSAEARREGIFKGMPLGRALNFCPHLTVLPPNPGLMEKAFQALGKKVSQYTPLWEPVRPGHIYLDVTGTERVWGRAKDVANRLRVEVSRELGLSGNLGVAGNKMISCIAARIIPAEGVLDVHHGRESAFIAPLRADILPGIRSFCKRVVLEELGINLVRDIAAMDMDSLKLVFGKRAQVMRQRARGIDSTPVQPFYRKPYISEEIILPVDDNDDRRILGYLYRLVEQCSRRLRRLKVVPGKGGVMFRYADHAEVFRQVRLTGGSSWDLNLYRPLESIFQSAFNRRVRIRFIKVWFRDFFTPCNQLLLFPSFSPEEKKRTKAIQALDRIRKKYGDASVWFGRGIYRQNEA